MNESSPFILFPTGASNWSSSVDAMTWVMVGLCGAISIGIFIAMTIFVMRYRDAPIARRAFRPQTRNAMEFTWTAIPFCVFLTMFVWAGKVYFDEHRPPANATEIFVVAKQWMWKFQHPDGTRELAELHIPVGTPIQLAMTSQDVIHSLFIPDFRIKQDVLPGRYTYIWFEATRAGSYHLFCAEYCGTSHAEMRAEVIAMEPADFQAWKSQQTGAGPTLSPTGLASRGRELFTLRGCISCHGQGSNVRAPDLNGVYMSRVGLDNGQTVIADENYLRESILNPKAKMVMGYLPIMPSFQGQLSEEDLLGLIAYLKSLKHAERIQER